MTDRTQNAKTLRVHCEVANSLRSELAAKDAKIDRLKAIIGRLPKTADGVPITHSMPVFFITAGGHVIDRFVSMSPIFVTTEPNALRVELDALFSTREAALAAKEVKPNE